MASMTDLIAELTDLANIQSSENFTTASLTAYICRAIKMHDKNLTIQTIPCDEEEPIVTLAWIKVCLVRASKFAREANISGAKGFGMDQKTPYDKQMDLVRKLTDRYSELCAKLRINRNQVVLGQIFVRDDIFDALVPLFQTPDAPVILLRAGCVSSNGVVVLQWSVENYSDFFQVLVFWYENQLAPIYQEWNFDSANGIPNTNNSATVLHTFNDPTVLSAQVTGLDPTQTHRFLLVFRSRTYRYIYSNELVVTPAMFADAQPPGPPSVYASRPYRGVIALTSGATQAVVSGLNLLWTPKGATCQVLPTSGGEGIDSWPLIDTLSTAGCTFQLGAATDSVNYVLSYEIF
jgi:hypothetical protein